MPDSFFSNLPLPCLQLSTKYFPDNDTAKLDMDACTVTCRFGPLTLWQSYRKLWNISRAHRLSKESRERNVEKEAETKGMTGLSALLAADFDLGMRPGPDASSCYVCVCVCGTNASYNVCLWPHSNTHLLCHLTDKHPCLWFATFCSRLHLTYASVTRRVSNGNTYS